MPSSDALQGEDWFLKHFLESLSSPRHSLTGILMWFSTGLFCFRSLWQHFLFVLINFPNDFLFQWEMQNFVILWRATSVHLHGENFILSVIFHSTSNWQARKIEVSSGRRKGNKNYFFSHVYKVKAIQLFKIISKMLYLKTLKQTSKAKILWLFKDYLLQNRCFH